MAGGVEAPSSLDPNAIWLDLDSPTAAEEAAVEQALGVEVPTPDERAAIEESARFYEENGALYLTATLLGRRDEGHFVSGPVTFILVNRMLVTVRQISPRAFEVGHGRASARIGSARTGAGVLIALLVGAAERLADLLANATGEINTVSADVFETASPDLRRSLRSLGRAGGLSALSLNSLSSLKRLLAFSRHCHGRHDLDDSQLEAIERDINELERLAEALQTRIAYVQDAALGLINAQQTDVLKALSLATIAFVPATLVASIFGMNFRYMHWFDAAWGPWAAFALMAATPLVLFAIAKWRRWF